MKTKLLLITTILLAAGSLTLTAAASAKRAHDQPTTDHWLTDYDTALAQAKQTGKRILINFTGSDWCGWCQILHEEVFSQPAFKTYADQNLILLTVDFPDRKPQSAAEKKANQALAQQYNIEGFPTIIILDSTGHKIGELGYQPGGPKPFLTALKKLKQPNP
jgi:protein disulfide-isomerase